jgi:hypothetical protein
MATLSELKAQIANDLARPDLTNEIAQALADAVDELGDNPFYFLAEEEDASTVASTPTIAQPSNFRRLRMLTVTNGTQRKDLPPDRHQISYDEYRSRVWDATSGVGEPSAYAFWNELVYLDPIPDQVYTITFSYFGPKLALPADESTSNAWTADAASLLRAKSKSLLFRDVIRNLEQWQIQEAVANSWVRKLLGRSAAQESTYLTRPRRF